MSDDMGSGADFGGFSGSDSISDGLAADSPGGMGGDGADVEASFASTDAVVSSAPETAGGTSVPPPPPPPPMSVPASADVSGSGTAVSAAAGEQPTGGDSGLSDAPTPPAVGEPSLVDVAGSDVSVPTFPGAGSASSDGPPPPPTVPLSPIDVAGSDVSVPTVPDAGSASSDGPPPPPTVGSYPHHSDGTVPGAGAVSGPAVSAMPSAAGAAAMAAGGATGASTPAGWYADPNGQQRWWDGQAWTAQVAPAPGQAQGPWAQPAHGRSVPVAGAGNAPISHIMALALGVIGAGIMYAVSSEKSEFERHHAAEALNFSITMMFATGVTIVLCFVLIGFLLLPVLAVVGFVLPIMGAMAASRGEWYRYPSILRLVKGPLD